MTHAPNPYDFLPPVPSFTVRSNDIADGETVERRFISGVGGAGGDDVSPHLVWEGFPPETKSFAVTCLDPDAPTASGFWHWALYNIPATVTELPTGAGDAEGSGLPDGAVQLKGDAGLAQYVGPFPPPKHKEHRYLFVVHAVDVESLDVDPGSPPAVLGFNLAFHALARAHITPVYENLD